VKNNAASVWNCVPVDNYRVYYNSGCAEPRSTSSVPLPMPAIGPDLDSALKRRNASQRFA
jgi:hypothetical protein